MNNEFRHTHEHSRRAGIEALRQFRPQRVALPVFLGLGFVFFVVYHELSKNQLTVADLFIRMNWTWTTGLWLACGALMLAMRDLGYMWQLRILTDGKTGWRSSFEIIMLWNFFAAVSPSMVGGAAVAVFMLGKEGVSLGRSTAIVFTTIFFDQVFYISIPLLVSLIVPQGDIFAPLEMIPSDLIGTSVYGAFWSGWGGMAAYVLLLIAALFIAPSWMNWWLTKLLMLPVMHRWRAQGLHLANELLIASRDLRDRSTRWWLTAWLATSVAWLGRYLVMNCILAAFSIHPLGLMGHILAAGRQAVLWIIMTLSPTPGSAGIAELGFTWLFQDLVPDGLALSLAILWRMMTYYPYLIIGIPVMTHWIKRVYGRDERAQFANSSC